MKILIKRINKVINLLAHISSFTRAASGVGIDYSPTLIASAGTQSALQNVNASWLVYDFNEDRDDLVNQLITTHHITHVFVYLVPKQLALFTVREILTKLCGSGVVSNVMRRVWALLFYIKVLLTASLGDGAR
jgi:hypothetical protein